MIAVFDTKRFAVVLAAASVLLAVPLAPPTASAVPAGETWAAELAVADGDDVDVAAADGAIRLRDTAPRTTTSGSAPAEGTLLLAPRRLGAVADRVSATATADTPAGSQVLVAVRGLRDDGSWSEWIPTGTEGPAQLPAATLQVQVRVTLVAGAGGTSPALRRLWLTADATPAPRRLSADTGAPFTARVFATRIGLVGNTTANGHRITDDDRFVALPSRRGLAPDGTGDYTVRVCAGNGRCAWAPVWDVGPWNVRDDYWSTDRQSFTDLPRGVPQAQAARNDGYNGGRDGFGRRVSNPAGIDLADGTFRRDLQLTDNSPVDVTYLWTGSGPAGTATGGDPVAVRSAPSPDAPDVGAVAPRSRVAVECSTGASATTTSTPSTPAPQAVARPTTATPTTAPATTSTPPGTSVVPIASRWLRLGTGQYVAATSLEVPDVPAC